MSISYDKRDFRDPSEILEEEDFSGDEEEEFFRRKTLQKYPVPAPWINTLCRTLQNVAKDDSVEIFDELTPDALADFTSMYDESAFTM
jgi:hypothetical protein